MVGERGWLEGFFFARCFANDEVSVRCRRRFALLGSFEVQEMRIAAPPFGEELFPATVRSDDVAGLRAWRERLMQTAHGVEVIQIADVWGREDVPADV